MIRIHLGNIGSGKTLTLVREMYLNQDKLKYYTNVKTSIKNNVLIDSSMIITKSPSEKKGKFDYSLNTDYWKAQKKPLIVALDEAHSIVNSRRVMSKQNVLVSEWLALLRRVVNTSTREGELILITQFLHKIDINCREMATQIRFHIAHYRACCEHCHFYWRENSEFPKDLKRDFCPFCGSITVKKDLCIEVFHFSGTDDYWEFYFNKRKTYYSHYILRNVDSYFPMYDTLQWDNLFSQYIE